MLFVVFQVVTNIFFKHFFVTIVGGKKDEQDILFVTITFSLQWSHWDAVCLISVFHIDIDNT